MNVYSQIMSNVSSEPEASDIVASYSLTELEGISCLLINMPIREQARPNNAPLGLCLLAGQLKKYGASAQILDLNSYRVHDRFSSSKNLKNGRVLLEKEAKNKIREYLKIKEYDLIA